MKSVRLRAPADLRIHDEAAPAAGKGEKVCRIRAVGLCGCDLHSFSEGAIGDAKSDHPLGHGFSGEADDGGRFALDPAISCGHLKFCEHGHPNLCSDMFLAGHGMVHCVNGRLGLKNVYFSSQICLMLPMAPILEPLGVALHGLKVGKLKSQRSRKPFA